MSEPNNGDDYTDYPDDDCDDDPGGGSQNDPHRKACTTHSERCEHESTRDVTFLFQERVRVGPGKRFRWKTIGVWLDRREAEAWGKAYDYRFARGWRVHGVPAEGRLAKMLQEQDEGPNP
jgi:hypothetical protein